MNLPIIYDAIPITFHYKKAGYIRGCVTPLKRLAMSPLMVAVEPLEKAFGFHILDVSALVLLEGESTIANPAVTLDSASKIIFHHASLGNEVCLAFLTEAAIAGIQTRFDLNQKEANPITLDQLSQEFLIPSSSIDLLLKDRQILGQDLVRDIVTYVWEDRNPIPGDIAAKIILAYALELYSEKGRLDGLDPLTHYILTKATWFPQQSCIKGKEDFKW